jgi:hypothetical protein
VDPTIQPSLEHVKGQTSAAKYLVMEDSDIEARAKLLPGRFSQFDDFQLSDLVAQSLSGPRDIAIHFRLNRRLVR